MFKTKGMDVFFIGLLLNLTFATTAAADSNHSNCASSTFQSWDFSQYPAGAEAFESSENWVDPKIYIQSNAIFGKMQELVLQAEKHVYIQTWTFQPRSLPARALAQSIRQLHANRKKKGLQEPVHFWFMLNIISLQNKDIERQRFRAFIKREGLNLDGIVLHVGFFRAKLLGANHAKTISVDSKVALVTGANFSPSNNADGFFDLAFVVKGEIVKNLDYDFIQIWKSFIGREGVPRERGASLNTNRFGCVPVLLTRSKPFPDPITKIQKSSMTDALLESIRHAKKSVDIITPNLNVTELLTEIARAALRGVQVRIVLSKGFTDLGQLFPTRGGVNKQSILRLERALEGHLNLKEFCQRVQIKWYSADGVGALETTRPPANHAKFMLVDDKISFLGSANMDNQSWINSREIGIFVDQPKLAKTWRKDFFDKVFGRSINIDKCL